MTVPRQNLLRLLKTDIAYVLSFVPIIKNGFGAAKQAYQRVLWHPIFVKKYCIKYRLNDKPKLKMHFVFKDSRLQNRDNIQPKLFKQRNTDAEKLRNQYLDGGGWQQIDGWLYLKALRLTDFLDKCQEFANITGNIGEIGLYFGKYFIFLYLICRNNENIIGVDLFEFSEWEKTFYQNFKNWRYSEKEPIIIKRNSLQIDSKELLEKSNGPYRMFSVDGGHSTEVALHDLRLANEVLVDGGIIMLDDYFDPKFPGVSEAVCRFFLLHPEEVRVAPFLITGNKLFFATKNYADLYRKAIDDAIDRAREEVWDSEIFGSKVITIL